MFEHIREDVQCVFGRDPAARNAFVVLTTYPGLWAVLIHRFSHWLWSLGVGSRTSAGFKRAKSPPSYLRGRHAPPH